MSTAAFLFLLFIAVVVVVQLAKGTLGQWLAAKFLGRPAASSGTAS